MTETIVNSIVIDLVFCALLWLVFGWRVMFVTVAIMVIIGVFLGIYIRRVKARWIMDKTYGPVPGPMGSTHEFGKTRRAHPEVKTPDGEGSSPDRSTKVRSMENFE
jgi:uncharacterized membrane protein YraQ (UPF0718 family)